MFLKECCVVWNHELIILTGFSAPYVSGSTVAAVGICVGAALLAAPFTLAAAGFKSVGVAAGSVAAYLQVIL